MAANVLVVEDEPAILELIAVNLEQAGFHVLRASEAETALRLIGEALPDLVLIDWMLPGLSGIELVRRLRREERTRALPLILLTARGAEVDKVLGLEAGADDYVTKPFSPRELIARLKAVLRRTATAGIDEPIEIEGLRLDPGSHRVSSGDTEVEFGPTEFRLLQFFMTHPERAYTRSQLLDHVWGGNVYVEERTVDVHIRRLRLALGTQHEHLVQTVRGTGYRFSTKV